MRVVSLSPSVRGGVSRANTIVGISCLAQYMSLASARVAVGVFRHEKTRRTYLTASPRSCSDTVAAVAAAKTGLFTLVITLVITPTRSRAAVFADQLSVSGIQFLYDGVSEFLNIGA